MGNIFDPQLWARIGVALFCGGILGLERQLRGKTAGVRTCAMICIGTAAFVHLGDLLALQHANVDPSRVLGHIAAGCGFLGLGMVTRHDDKTVGITSAAVVWLLAAVGSFIGFGRYADAVALSLASVVTLVGVERLEKLLSSKLRKGSED